MKPIAYLTLVLWFLPISATTKSSDSQTTFEGFDAPISLEHNQINVMVHPGVELISIIQTIGNYPNVLPFLMADQEYSYKSRVLEHFSPLAKHPAVQMFDRLSSQPRKLNFSAPSNIMLYADENLQLRQDITMNAFVVSRIDGLDSLIVFLELLRNFAQVSDFNAFYSDNKEYYQSIINRTTQHMTDYSFIRELEDFFGRSQQSYNIILVSLYSSVGYGNWMLLPNGKKEIYNTMGMEKVKEEMPFFGDEDYLKHLIRHEFSHPFINPVTDLYHDLIMPHADRFDALPEAARRNVCHEWEECINEFIIRAITTWLAQQESLELGQWAYDYELNRGVIYLDELLQKIEDFHANRETYPTLNDYYPQLLEVFLPEHHQE